ncbi:ATP-binding protein [Peribacillus asahii]|uniref:ATP-binding protein n=1 Tax=Peribacillus asahii TaxID=228899 RepID=UPI0020799C2F|nr:ATP-binding protein [Peribacillus asahii]USK71727.1 AAA family ATPase [Peribacillus asahii]
MPRVIFISGIHGSGKTTLGKNLSNKLGIEFAISSEVIKKELKHQNWDNEKRVSNIEENQNILCNGIEKNYANSKTIILDGHFSLLNREKRITNLPFGVFSQLNITFIITCITKVDLIKERLQNRDNNNDIDIHQLETFQKTEINQAQKIANQLNVPLILFNTQIDSEEDLFYKLKKGGIKG